MCDARMSSSPPEPSDTSDMTEAQLALLRARLQSSLGALETRLHELRDWRTWIRRHPLPFAMAAFTLGLLLGLRRTQRRGSVTRR
jgi:hypothetical protein